MLLPLFVLAIGAIFAGFLFKDLFIGHGGDNIFWGNSIKFLNPLSTEHPPLWLLLTTPVLVLISIPIAYYLFVKEKSVPYQIIQSNKPLYNLLINKWYFDELYDVLFIQSSKKLGLFFWKVIDVKIIDKFGPDGVSLLIKNLSLKASKFQSGFIYQYAFMILLGFSLLLTFLILS
jgi:NADH-quinone oxidoreductase subunit L